MYKKNQHRQFRFTDFNQPVGLKMDPENRWVKKVAMIPWDAIEEKYAELFPSDTDNPAKPVRMALGALLIHLGGALDCRSGRSCGVINRAARAALPLTRAAIFEKYAATQSLWEK